MGPQFSPENWGAKLMRYYLAFRRAIPHQGVGSYVLLSRSRLSVLRQIVPLACLRHAASVRPGPGSNPQNARTKSTHVTILCACPFTPQADISTAGMYQSDTWLPVIF